MDQNLGNIQLLGGVGRKPKKNKFFGTRPSEPIKTFTLQDIIQKFTNYLYRNNGTRN